MIRSILIVPNPEHESALEANPVSANGLAVNVTAILFTLRRKLTQEKLETCFAEGRTLWIDIVRPEAEEFVWLA